MVRLWILTQYYPPEIGAAAVRLSRLARDFAMSGHQVTVITSVPNYPTGIIPDAYKGKLFYTEWLDGITVIRVRVFASPKKGARQRLANQISFMLLAALRGTSLAQPDAIIVESHPLFVCLAGGWLKRVKRANILLNVSDLWPESAVATGALSENSLLVKLAKPVEKWAYRDAAHIVGMTGGVVEGIIAVDGKPDHVTRIQNAVDLATFRPCSDSERRAARTRFGLDPTRFVVVHVGNMSLTYDFDLMLNAAAQLPDVLFHFVGGGSQFEYVQNGVRERNLSNVILSGVLSHDQMPGVWASADATLIALRDHSVAGGTLPAKMYEGLATGTPVVAAIRGEGESLLREAGAGVIVPIGNLPAMVNALAALANDGALRLKLSQAGRRYAEQHLSPERVKQAYLSLLKKVIDV